VHVLFSKSCFVSDMRKRRTKYCTPLLFNAMLALACHYSCRVEARADVDDPRTVGDHFFREARRLLYEEERGNGDVAGGGLAKVQALAVMSIREAGCGRDESGWGFLVRAVGSAVDLGLVEGVEKGGEFSITMGEVRRITGWGVFLLDKWVFFFLWRKGLRGAQVLMMTVGCGA
jgi:hypothetical protein